MTPWTLGSERSNASSALARRPRPASGSAARMKKIHAAASARRSRLGAVAPGSRRMTRRVSHTSGATASSSASATAATPIFSPVVARSPTASSQLPIRLPITVGGDRNFPPDRDPELRIEDARRPGECLAREQLAPRRADAGREVVGLQQHGAGGAQVGVERVVPLFLALELLGRDVGGRRGLARFGRQLREPLGGGGEPRRELRDRPLKSDAERVVLGLEGLQIGVGEVLVPQRRFGRGEGRARLVEIERMARPAPRRARAPGGRRRKRPRERPRTPMQLAQGGRRLHRRQNGPEADSAARSLIHPTMAGPPRQLAPSTVLRMVPLPALKRVGGERATAPLSILPREAGEGNRGGGGAKTAFTLPREKGCAPAPALLKGALKTSEGRPVTPTVEAPTFADPVSQAPRSAGERALDHFLAAGFERTEPPVLHPAAIFLDMSGEEVRRRLFLTAGAAGEELCLRPEYTIPVCRAYLASDRAGGVAEYSYLGPVFRARAGQAGEETQTGLESFGRNDAEAADAEVFALSLEAATAAGGGRARRPARRRRPVRGRPRFARHPGGLAPPLAPRRRARAQPRRHLQSAEPGRARAGGRAGGAGKRRPRRRESAGRGPAGDRRHRDGRRAQRRRDRRPVPRTGFAPLRRADRGREAGGAGRLPGHFRRSRRGRDRASAPRRVRAARPRCGDRFVRDAQRLHRRPRRNESRICASAPPSCATSTITPASCSRPTTPRAAGAKTALAGGRYDGLARRLGAGADIPAVGAAITLDRLANGEKR